MNSAKAPDAEAPVADDRLGQAVTVSASNAASQQLELRYREGKVIGHGAFGVVMDVLLVDTNETAVIKRVLQDRRFKNREVQIMKMLAHDNIVTLKYYFMSKGESPEEVFLNLVLEFVPVTLHKVIRRHAKLGHPMPLIHVKLYLYQLMRALAVVHSFGICHRDVKPPNVLLNPQTGVVKLCDFGSAKPLVRGEASVAYLCPRYYRAPELIFGSVHYTTSIDVWSAGCIASEMLLGQPLLPGESSIDQLVEIIKVLGIPSAEDMLAMNPAHNQFKFPAVKPTPWHKVFPGAVPEAVDLVSRILVYKPDARLSSWDALAHPFFDELRDPATTLPNGGALPDLFNFSERERGINPDILPLILPSDAANVAAAPADAVH